MLETLNLNYCNVNLFQDIKIQRNKSDFLKIHLAKNKLYKVAV